MARSCACAGQGACGCLLVGGDYVTITGIGSQQDPYVVTADASTVSIDAKLSFIDTATVGWTITGDGTDNDPLQLEALATGTLWPSAILTHSGGNLDLTAYVAGAVLNITLNDDVDDIDLPTVPGGYGTTIKMVLTQGTGAPNVVTAWSTVLWAGGTPPTLSTSGSDVVRLESTGSVWYGVVEGLDYS